MPPFDCNSATKTVRMIANELDAFLAALGYAREGLYYRVTEQNIGTIAVFCHGGSSSAVYSHLLNLPFPFVCNAMPADFTSVTVVSFSSEIGRLVAPQIELFADARHIKGLEQSLHREIAFGR